MLRPGRDFWAPISHYFRLESDHTFNLQHPVANLPMLLCISVQYTEPTVNLHKISPTYWWLAARSPGPTYLYCETLRLPSWTGGGEGCCFPPWLEIKLHPALGPLLVQSQANKASISRLEPRLGVRCEDCAPLSFLANTNYKYLMEIFAGLTVLTVEDSWRTTIHHWGWRWPSSSSPSASSSAAPWRRSSVSSATGVSPS